MEQLNDLVQKLRNDYSQQTLNESDVATNPFLQFEKWMKEAIAAQLPEPNAMTIATVSSGGMPAVRVVLLRSLEDNKFSFYTNYHSQKGRELESNPHICANFFWPELERQIRITGVVGKQRDEKSTQYFESRPRGSQIGAWASPQSQIIPNRNWLENAFKEAEKRFKDQEIIPRPENWGGYDIIPEIIEFWQGRRSRLHDRIIYTKNANTWKIERKAP
jgi:pyridoxamine 5'-phosphate oxidase